MHIIAKIINFTLVIASTNVSGNQEKTNMQTQFYITFITYAMYYNLLLGEVLSIYKIAKNPQSNVDCIMLSLNVQILACVNSHI